MNEESLIEQYPSVEYFGREFLQYSKDKGFEINNNSFQLVVEGDKNILFTNATVTPYLDNIERMLQSEHMSTELRIALVQRCLRVGGKAGTLESTLRDPNYSSLFTMAGYVFTGTYNEASRLFLETLTEPFRLPRDRIRMVVPESDLFIESLLDSGFDLSELFIVRGTDSEYWTDWTFGRYRKLKGTGITAIVLDDPSLLVMDAIKFGRYIEIGNLINIMSTDEANKSSPIFDIGIGLSRIQIVSTGKPLYELSPLSAYMDLLKEYNIYPENENVLRFIVDHVRIIKALVKEGLYPGKNRHEYVLRKVIRNLFNTLFVGLNTTEFPQKLLSEVFSVTEGDDVEASDDIVSVLDIEYRLYVKSIRNAIIRIGKAKKGGIENGEIDIDYKYYVQTYGLPNDPRVINLFLKET